MPQRIHVVPYDTNWERLFKEESALIGQILGPNLDCIHHIGSTAVFGLCAKPIIDILPVVFDLSAVDGQTGAFWAAGYEAMGEFGIPGRRYFRKGGDRRTHQLHIFEKTNVQEIERHLAFCDYLRAHPEKARIRRAAKTAGCAVSRQHRPILRRQGPICQTDGTSRASLAPRANRRRLFK